MSDNIESSVIELSELVKSAIVLTKNYDKTPAFISGHHTFFQEENRPGTIVVTCSDDGDFYGSKLNLYLSARRVKISNPESGSELVFRPADYTCVKDGSYSSSQFCQRWLADCFFEIQTQNGSYCNMPLPVLHSFSGRADNYREPDMIGAVFGNSATSPLLPWHGWAGAKTFNMPFRIKRGTSISVIVSPKYTPMLPNSASYKYEMRITALFRGSKRIHSFL
jgi:hypothetical protein